MPLVRKKDNEAEIAAPKAEAPLPPKADALLSPDREILRIIPRDAGVVLEIGCSDGRLGESYKQYNPFAKYLGIALSEEAALVAKSRIDKAVHSETTEINLKNSGASPKSIDCIIYNGFLELVSNPAEALALHSSFLKDDGVMVLSIANLQYWKTLRNLLASKWTGQAYPDQRSFFTVSDMTRLLDEAGLKFVDAIPVRVAGEARSEVDNFFAAMSPVLSSMGIDEAKFRSQCSASHYVIRAVKKERKVNPILIHSLMLAPQAACNDVRIIEPNSFISTIPGVACHNEVKTMSGKYTSLFSRKVLIYQRPIIRYAQLDIPKAIISRGYLMVVEFDDHINRWPGIEENKFLTFRGAHAVQTSTPALYQYFKQFNPHVKIFPNQLAKLPPKRKPRNADEPLRVFFGALNREKDWAPIMESVNKAIEKLGDKIFFHVVYDQKFFENLKTSNKSFTPLCSYDEYQRVLSACDINLMPLEDNEFNNMKSDLKFVESAGYGVVALASPVVYNYSVENGKTGFILNSGEQFGEKLVELSENPAMWQAVSDAGYEYVKNNRLQVHHYRERYNWYVELLDNYADLNHELKERVPEYFS